MNSVNITSKVIKLIYSEEVSYKDFKIMTHIPAQLSTFSWQEELRLGVDHSRAGIIK